MKINLSDVPSNNGTFEDLPEGRYEIIVEKADIIPTSTEKPMLKMQYRITEGKYKKRVVFDQCVIQDNTRWKLKTMLQAVGSNLTNQDNVDINDLPKEFIRKEYSVYIKTTKSDFGTNYQCSQYQTLDGAPTSSESESNVFGV